MYPPLYDMIQLPRVFCGILLSVFFLSGAGCYSLRSTAIPIDMDSFYVATFDNRADNVVPVLAPQFTEELKDKLRNESRLIYAETDPDISFSGSITEYRVSPRVVQEGEAANFSDLTISVMVICETTSEEYEPWQQRFSYALPFDNTQNLLDIQEGLIDQINEQLVEDIFNKAFNNW